MRGRRTRAAMLVAISVALLAGAATGQVSHRFAIADDLEGRAYPSSLAVVATSPDEYVLDYVISQGAEWKGPRAQAALKPDLGGEAHLRWEGKVLREPISRATILSKLVHGWAVVAEGREAVERTVRGRDVGSIEAVWVVTKAGPLPNFAQHEAGVMFPICGRNVLVRIFASSPSDDLAGPYGAYSIGGMSPSAWNRRAVQTTIERLALDGNMLPSRITARRAGARVTGAVTDCNGDPVASQALWLERRVGKRWVRATSGRTSATGTYALRTRGPGVYRVAVGARRSAAVRVG